MLALYSSVGLGVSREDDLGHTLTLEHPAQRIVTLAPHATELAIAAGLQSRLLAVAAGSPEVAAISGLPRIGGPGALDREALLRLDPDLVIAWQSGNRPRDLDWIERKGIALFRSEPAGPAGIARSIRALGALGGTGTKANAAAAAFERSMDTECKGTPPLAVYIEIWRQPPMSLGGRHWLNRVLAAAGLRNHLEALPFGTFKIANEAEYRARRLPRVSLVRRFDGSEEDRLADALSRPGPSLADAVQILCDRRLGGRLRHP